MENEFTIGQIFSKSFDIFAKNFVFMLLVALLVSIPNAVIAAAPDSPFIIIISFLFLLVMGFVAQGIVVFGVFQHLTGRAVVFAESLNVALGRLFPLLLVAFAVGIMTMVGYMLLVIPGIIISLILWVAIPVTIVEKGGVGYALQRSKDLTTGYRGRIFVVVFLLGLLSGGLSLIQTAITAGMMSTGPGSGGLSTALVSLPLQTVFTGLASALNSVVVTVGYYTLRHEVEGVAAEDLAAVFE